MGTQPVDARTDRSRDIGFLAIDVGARLESAVCRDKPHQLALVHLLDLKFLADLEQLEQMIEPLVVTFVLGVVRRAGCRNEQCQRWLELEMWDQGRLAGDPSHRPVDRV